MAYDQFLAERLRELLATEPDMTEKSMFGGRAFLVAGHLAVAAGHEGKVLVRVDPAQSEELLSDPRVEPMVMRGRAMKGWLQVDLGAGDPGDTDLERFVDLGVGYARSLPPR